MRLATRLDEGRWGLRGAVFLSAQPFLSSMTISKQLSMRAICASAPASSIDSCLEIENSLEIAVGGGYVRAMTTRRKGGAKGGADPVFWLGDPLPEKEAAMWAALSQAQRAKAIQRMTALDRWLRSDGAIDARQAASDAGVKSVTRLYEMGKAWRETRSLASLGTFAGAPKTRVGRHDATIRKALASVVSADPEGSVRKLALDLEAASAITDDPPSHNTFRRYVEEEKRRRQQRSQAGYELMLDCSACTLTPSDTDLLTVFAILDRGTQVILGASLGDIADSRAGYAAAARDAMDRLERGELADLPWVGRMERAEIVVGQDVAAWDRVRDEAADAGVGAPLEPSTRENRFGRYLRPLTGLRIGTVVVMPKHTSGDADVGSLVRVPTPTPDHALRLAVEVNDYNAARVGDLKGGLPDKPPPGLLSLLRFLAVRSAS